MNFKIAACVSVETQLFPTHLAKACCDNGFRILDMATGSRSHCERFVCVQRVVCSRSGSTEGKPNSSPWLLPICHCSTMGRVSGRVEYVP